MEKSKRFWTEQRKREYIRSAEDNLFIIAGPGTGKTTLLSRRILNQIMGGERLSHFLLIAFTEEAVQEFKQKIKKHLYREIAINREASHRLKKKVHGIDLMHIMTFDDFCLWVLSMKKKETTEEQEKNKIERDKSGEEVKTGKEAKSGEEAKTGEETEKSEEALSVEERCYRLLQEDKALLQVLRRDFSKIYADELQDLNQIQLNILLSLATDKKGKMRHNCLFMVGDPRQTIYQEAEEDKQVFFDMKKKMEEKKNVRVLYLNENYRANKMLVDWINEAFRKRMHSYRDMYPSQRKEFLKHCPFHGVFRRDFTGEDGIALRELVSEILFAYPDLKERDFLILCKSKEKQEYYKKSLSGVGFSDSALDKMVFEAHLSKGLNANIVIITEAGGNCSGKMENRLTRLEYVAVTRAKHVLIFLKGETEEWFCDQYYGLHALQELSLGQKQ